jgi:hypothetical protein
VPVCEIDPWRTQYFERVACPESVLIPTEDSDAWLWNTQHRWVYDKLAVALSQGLDAAPHGIAPHAYPVFSKPIYNLKGMGVGSRALASADDYAQAYQPGHFWSTLLTGDHVSSDVAVINGVPLWWRHARGVASGGGTFDYWEVEAAANDGYTGMANLETIGGQIIEVHLRFADQWPDLYGGDRWVEALVALYEKSTWTFDDRHRRTGYSVVLFMPHGPHYRHPPSVLQREIAALPDISSLQITFHEEWSMTRHAMPPGGFRVAIINCWDRAAGNVARDRLRDHFAETAA